MKRIGFIAICLFCTIASAPARADTAAEARAAYQEGKQAFKAGNYREALISLKKAYKLQPRPALLRYMGDTFYKMNKARQAINAYKSYLNHAPQAADRDKVQAKVRQLELIVGSGDEEEDDFGDTEPTSSGTAPPPPPDLPADTEEPTSSGSSSGGTTTTTTTTDNSGIDLRPTGEDTEDPLAAADRRRKAREAAATRGSTDKGGGSSAVGVAKWVMLGVGVAGLVVGGVFQGLAGSKASELEDRVRTDCPKGQTNCGGNPDMNSPVVEYNIDHWNLEQSYKTNQKVAIGMFIAGGVVAATSAVLFIVDSGGKEERRAKGESRRRVVVAPMVGPETYGVAGAVNF